MRSNRDSKMQEICAEQIKKIMNQVAQDTKASVEFRVQFLREMAIQSNVLADDLERGKAGE